MDNVFKLPNRSNIKRIVREQPETKIYVVNFKTQTLEGEVVIDNTRNEVIEKWGKSPKINKKSKVA